MQETPNLSDILVEIQSIDDTLEEQAGIAFDRISEFFDIPKMPIDKRKYYDFYRENGIDEPPRSVFEEHALLKYLKPGDDPRGLVLSAIYHVVHNVGIDPLYAAKKAFGDNIPSPYQIGYRGEGINGVLVFPQLEDKSWTELGCISLEKEYK